MFGGKKKRYREEALLIMFLWVPSISQRDLNLFGVLQKFQFDKLYNNGAQAHEAAFCMGSTYFCEVIRRAENGDPEYFKFMSQYSGWLGACADHIVTKTDFLTEDNKQEVTKALERAKSVYMMPGDDKTLGEYIEIEKAKAEVLNEGVKKINSERGIT